VRLSSFGTTLDAGGSFYVHPRMMVSAVVPAAGPVAGGTRVALLGSGFRETTALYCRFEGSGATVAARHVGARQIECAAPPSSGAGSRAVEVTMNGQQFSSSGVAYTYRPAAAVSSRWPSSGAVEGGTPVTVSGSGFSAAAEAEGALQCRFNGTVVRAAYVSETSIVCNSTQMAAGAVAVEVSTNGRDFTSDDVLYEAVRVLVAEVAPWSGPDAGGTVLTVSGASLSSAARLTCLFGSNVSVQATVHSVDSARCVSPAGLPLGWTSVGLSSFGTPLLGGGGSFYVHGSLALISAVPSMGPVAGGTRIALLGSGVPPIGTVHCKFGPGGSTVVARRVASSQIECAAPPSSGAGVRPIEVTMNGQQYSSSGVTFTYLPAAAVSSVSPESGAAEGGTPVTVSGTGFSSAAAALGALQCRFGSTVVPAALVSASTIVCNSTHATPGSVALEVSNNGRDFT
ncbi:MAG: IPT/TIG domain-containing protein, partial [Planctomycetota bacterium]|nr:IPT/TIG domain-containing protein [Planctomycetota bacterium]